MYLNYKKRFKRLKQIVTFSKIIKKVNFKIFFNYFYSYVKKTFNFDQIGLFFYLLKPLKYLFF
ncbi:hypothetical protein PSOL_03800 [Candidatus Phytoplasma solani]